MKKVLKCFWQRSLRLFFLVYDTALNWNGISGNVPMTVIMETYGMPTIAGTINVYGNASGELEPTELGKTMFYNSKNSGMYCC